MSSLLLGTLVQHGIKLGKTPDSPADPAHQQAQQLRRLLEKARRTAFGRQHFFDELLREWPLEAAFQQAVPAAEYDDFYKKWWQRSRADEPDVTWPGTLPYYALSSGTSGASSKYIPVSTDMLRDMKKASRRMFFDLAKYCLPARQFTRQMLMVGSCTALKTEGRHHVGDLSGIIGLNRPVWLEGYYRPGRFITDLTEWRSRIEAIAHEALRWDIGFAVANPMWLHLILERILEKHRLQSIHDIWPNFRLLVHGGVFFEPYRLGLERMFAAPMHYVDSYMASEGFFAYQNGPASRDLQLLADCGVYFEFVPFGTENFDGEDNLRPGARALALSDVREGEEYAVLISTSSGAWRYLLGDTLRFTDLSRMAFRITGRTKQCLSVCGEHLSLDNLNEAVRRADAALGAGVREFAVAGLRRGSGWMHQWWFSLDNPSVAPGALLAVIDRELKTLNDDYAVEREYALRSLEADFVPNEMFLDWLRQRGKMNGQAKIPRVLKGDALTSWQRFLQGSAAGWAA